MVRRCVHLQGFNAAIGGGLSEQMAKAVVPDLLDHCGGEPYFCNAARKLQGAPPDWAFSVGEAAAATGAKSMSISPRATIVGMSPPFSVA